jgi:malate synthase
MAHYGETEGKTEIIEGLTVDSEIVRFVAEQACPDSGIEPEQFWRGYAELIDKHGEKNAALLAKRDDLQRIIDRRHLEKKLEKDTDSAPA